MLKSQAAMPGFFCWQHVMLPPCEYTYSSDVLEAAVMKNTFVLLVLATALCACSKKENPANQAAQDIKAMGGQRDKAQDALKALEESRQKASDAAARAAEGEAPKD